MSNVGRYRIRRRLGLGGMAEVLEAEALGDAGFVRRVAIKRMLGTVKDDESFARMFLDEARIASHLHHANIVSVLDYGVVDGTPFQVLELVDGLDARSLIRRSQGGRVPEDIALYIVAQIGHALTAAHSAKYANGEEIGIVHRDVSPGNVLLSWDGDVKLADFGIAFAKDKTEKTEAGMTKGTLVYMSPEQALTGRVDARSDVFSLGCVLHALLTGLSPLAEGRAQRFHLERTLKLAPDLPEDVRSILEIATRFDKTQRFQSAAALTEAVGSALATRIDREPRRRLMEYLAPLRAKHVETPGRLDAHLCVDIVVDAGPTERHFRTAGFETTETSAGERAATTLLYPGVSPLAPPPPYVAARATGRGPLVVLFVVAALAGGGALAWMVGRPLLAARAGASARASPPPPPPTAASSVAVAVAGSAAEPAEPATPEPSAATSARLATRAPARAPTPAASLPPKPTSCSGTVYLSCPAAPRAPIAIDGAASSYHHGDFANLSCDAHAIVFEASDGRRDRHSAAPSSANTRTSPLEIRCRLD